MSILPRIKTRRDFIKQSAITTALLPFLFSCRQSLKSLSSVLDKDVINKFRKNPHEKLDSVTGIIEEIV